MYNNSDIRRSNIDDIESSLKKRFKNARKINYSFKNQKLTGSAIYRNQLYSYYGAMDASDAALIAVLSLLVYSFITSVSFAGIASPVWSNITFFVSAIIWTIACYSIADPDEDSAIVIVIGINIVFIILSLLLMWQIQHASDYKGPMNNILFDILFKYKF